MTFVITLLVIGGLIAFIALQNKIIDALRPAQNWLRQYVLAPLPDARFARGCWKEITDVIPTLRALAARLAHGPFPSRS